MFEGLVRQLILGYLGQYIKDIQKEQLKITLWNEEVLLENVELILEAFDYLRLPFAFKKGQVGKLSIRIPWKKLGWDPIIIVLEDIYICVCQRDDEEWCKDAVEKRDLASKKARLAAAELAKLSRRVCDNQTGKSFISYITAKILDSIQVSIRNFHFLYRDTLTETENVRFGLRFSSLTVTRRSPLGSSTAKVRGGQVNKLIEVQNLEVYCSMCEKGDDLCAATAMGSENEKCESLETDKYSSMLAPLNVIVSLSVNRSGNLLNDAPQYTINVELSQLDMSVHEVQLQQILLLGNYMSLCHLREKYGRFRPWWCPLVEKHEGWQVAWWKYAQESVLSDVRRRLKKTSWKYLGDRLSSRRKYVNLYKTKLKCLRHDQVIEEHVQLELEEMDKETDIDDILNYRSLAERELEDFLVNPSSSRGNNGGISGTPGEDDQSSSKPRGWLNWLSYGMLGAGGTNDSVQFSGVISDEVIKDIYEATKFHPAAAVVGDSSAMDEVYLSSMRINILQFRLTLRRMEMGQAIADLALKRILVQGNVWEKSTVITTSVTSAEMLNPSNSQVVLLLNEDKFEDDAVEKQRPAVDIKVDLSTRSGDVNSSVKVVLDPVQVFCDSEFIRTILDFVQVLKDSGFQQERILLSLNGFDDLSTRVLSKIDYVLSSHKKIMWDINLFNTSITIPLENTDYGLHKVVVEAASLSFASVKMDCIGYHKQNQSHVEERNIRFTSVPEDLLLGSRLQELYDKSEIQTTGVQMKILTSSSNTVPLIEKFNPSMSLVSCILSDEPVLKALEVYVKVPSLSAHFSTSIYGVILGLITQYNLLLPSPDSPASLDLKLNELKKASVLPWMSIDVSLDAIKFLVNLEDDIADDGSILKLYCQKLDLRYDQKDFLECCVSVLACRMTAGSVRDEWEKQVVFSSGTVCDSGTECQSDMDVNLHGEDRLVGDGGSFADRCILLHYEGRRNTEWFLHESTVFANDLEIHCYPHLIGKFNGFLDRMSGNISSDIEDKKSNVVDGNVSSVSDITNSGSYDSESIPSGHFLLSLFENLKSLCDVESIVNDVRHILRKSLHLREQGNRQQNVNFMDRTKVLSDPLVNYNTDVGSPGGAYSRSDTHLSSLKLGSITVHFHDSSCILGTIVLPAAESLICSSADILDIVCLTEGVVLSSTWWCEMFSEILWGPLSTNLSPILNLHVKRRTTGSSESRLELSFDIQHVSCMLPPEFLSIMIGYFSLPDWRSFSKQQSTINLSSEDPCRIVYNIEIVDCDIITPANCDYSECLKLNVGTLCIIISEDSEGGSISKEIPSACRIGDSKFADRNLCLDFSGRDLCLLFLVWENSSISNSTAYKSISLVAPLTADVWVRIPSDEISGLSPMCIMAMVDACQLEIDEICAISGCKALVYATDQFTRVERDSKLFTSDVPHFLLSVRDATLLPETSVVTFIEVRFFVRSLSLRFNQYRSDSTYSELLAEAKMQFLCSLSLVDEIPRRLDISFSSLALFSFLNSVVLAECACPGQGTSALDIIHFVSDHGEQQFVLTLPCLDVWLHLIDWIDVIDLLNSCSEQLSKVLISGASTDTVVCGPADVSEHVAVDGPNNVGSANMTPGAGFSLTLEHVGLAIHFPALLGADRYKTFGRRTHDMDSLDENCSKLNYSQHCFFSISLQIKNSGLVIEGQTMKLSLSFENLTGVLKLFEGGGSQIWPIFQLSKVSLEAGILMYRTEEVRLKIDILCDSLDFSLSNQTLYLFQFTWIEKSEENSSQFSFKRMDFKVQLRKLSLLLTDWKSTSGPLLEFLVRDAFILCVAMEDEMDGSVDCDLQVNYYNIDKVLWEPFLEPWKFQMSMNRKHDDRALFTGTVMTDINLRSTTHLNVNLNESIIEVISRAVDMISDAWLLVGKLKSQGLSNSQMTKDLETGRQAPYMLQNLTTVPLSFHVCQRGLPSDDLNVAPSTGVLQPGSSTNIYINESPEELFRYRPVQPSDRLNDRQLLEAAHRYVSFQLEGTSAPSTPISMDLVGRRYFEVESSTSAHVSEVYTDNIKRNFEGNSAVAVRGFATTVVVDVSVQSFTKLMRLYSTVLILNTTSIPLEVRIDKPFVVSPEILGTIYPSQEFPLPLHLTEAGCIRWRPCGDSYLWSEAYNISNIISQDVRIGFLRSFVCYPSHPSSEAFRCCISVSEQHLPPVGRLKRVTSGIDVDRGEGSLGVHTHNLERPKNRSLYQVMLSSPLMFKNYLMRSISLILEYGGVARAAFLSEVETSMFHIDSSHDLSVTIQMHGFRPSNLRFPRAESFSTAAKFSGTKFCMSEVLRFDPEASDGPLYVTIEKVMDAFSGAREISISVPFLLYNCSGFSLILSNSLDETKGYACIIPSCYNLDEKNGVVDKKDGLSFICTHHDGPATDSTSETISRSPDFVEKDSRKVTACLFSPDPNSHSGEVMVRLSRYMSSVIENFSKGSWSAPFSLVPPTGSTSILVCQPSMKSAHVISVTAVAAPFSGKTKIITFEPRYVIANACSKSVYYKQKGTDLSFPLEVGQHSYIQWTDTTRDLLVSVRFDESGSEWSGCFLPEHLGDTQVKVRNYMTTAVSMVRVEVRSADVYASEGKIVGSTSGNSGTNLIVLFEDDTCFMPYRIDNLSRERLRVYQPKCESFETLIHSYTSTSYAWDEPCFPHRLIIEVPGERILGSYNIDDTSVHSLVHMRATSEKPERNILISVHSEGAIKVLSIIDSSYHVLNDMKRGHVPQLKDKRKQNQKYESVVDYKEILSLDIPFLGISLMSSHPEELLFACAKNTKVSFVQNLDQQKFLLQILSFQIDNQLHSTPYPVFMSFNHGNKGHILNQMKPKEYNTKILTGTMTQVAPVISSEPVFSIAFSKWRNKDTSLISFESICVRIADFYLDVEQEIVLRLFEFCKTTSLRMQNRVFQHTDSALLPDLIFFGGISGNAHSFARLDEEQTNFTTAALPNDSYERSYLLHHIVPVGAPWQQIQIPSKKQKKIYIELLDMAPIKLTLSFSSSPWMLRQGVLTSGESLIHRGLMALADVEGAKIHFKDLVLSHQIASMESVQEILVNHYSRQFLHEMYKVFGSAGVIGNPMGFARTLGLGIKDFLSLPVWNVFQSPTGLFTGMAQGTNSLLSNTVYAISDATTQFSKAAHKGIVAFTFDDGSMTLTQEQKGTTSQSKGVINEFLEGLTGVLQSPIRGAEKYGLPGVLSGIAVGITGLVARPAASILEVTGKTAQSIRNRSRIHQMGHRYFRVRLPRPLSTELPLKTYSWEEAIGTYILTETDLKLMDETLVTCKALKQSGQYALLTGRLILVVSFSSLTDLGDPQFEGVPPDLKWDIQSEIALDRVILADNEGEVVRIVGSSSDKSFTQHQQQQKKAIGSKGKPWNNVDTSHPLFLTNLELKSQVEADEFLRVLLLIIEKGKEQGLGSVCILHQTRKSSFVASSSP